MKRCPECGSFFPNAEQFCDLDGTALVGVEESPPASQSIRTLLPIGVFAGILLGVLLSLLYFAMSRQPAKENSDTTSLSSSTRQQESLQPQQPAQPATPSPSVEPSVEPSASPSIETPSPQYSAAPVELNGSSPISTSSGATGKSNPVVITLNSGATIEADEAWQTGEGIWYRKSGIVSLLDPKNVKAVEKVSHVEPRPSNASPSP